MGYLLQLYTVPVLDLGEGWNLQVEGFWRFSQEYNLQVEGFWRFSKGYNLQVEGFWRISKFATFKDEFLLKVYETIFLKVFNNKKSF